MSDAKTEYVVRRRTIGGSHEYHLEDPATGEVYGRVFKYVGYWWANNAGDMRRRLPTKDAAIVAAWREHVERGAAAGVGGTE